MDEEKINERFEYTQSLIYRLNAETSSRVDDLKRSFKTIMGWQKTEAIVMSLVVSLAINVIFLLIK